MTQLLEDARALDTLFSDPNNWIQGDLYELGDDGKCVCYCLVGGIDTACGIDFTSHLKYSDGAIHRSVVLSHEVEQVIAEESGLSPAEIVIPEWNDAPERTVEDVQRIAAKTVARLEKAE